MRRLLALLLLIMPAAAQAEWHEAQSTNFVIYADDSERDVRRFAERLERFHAAMANLIGRDPEPPSPSNRVTVFVVGSQRQVARLAGDGRGNIAGFYIPRAGGATAFVPDVRVGGRTQDFSMTVLLHEYTHHLMHTTSTFAAPRWLGEGTAEFFSSTRFSEDGGLSFGLPAAHRYAELVYFNVPVSDLLDPQAGARPNRDGYYGKAWALYHYLTFEESRRGQLARYVEALNQGQSMAEAAAAAFGDLDSLGREVDAYLRRSRIMSLRYRQTSWKPGPSACEPCARAKRR